jgi:hypothetical protein
MSSSCVNIYFADETGLPLLRISTRGFVRRTVFFFDLAVVSVPSRAFTPAIEDPYSSVTSLVDVSNCGSCCVFLARCVGELADAAVGLKCATSGSRDCSGKGGKYHFGSVAGGTLSRLTMGVVVEAGNALGKGNCTAGVFGITPENNGATACCTA